MAVTIPQTQTNLLSYFMTSDVPTQDQMTEFIGTMFYMYNQTVANAAAAAASAASAATSLAAALAQLPVILGVSDWNGGTGAYETIGTTIGIASVATGTSGRLRVNFTTAFLNTNYKVFFLGNTVTITSKNVAYIEFDGVNPGSGTNPVTFVIWT